jgi:hypothetical protein
MSVVITRTPWIDDDGTGTTGTVLNNAMKTGLYNEIDTALAKVAQLAGGNAFTGGQSISGGIFNVFGFGTHAFSANGTGANALQVTNGAAGVGNYSQFTIGNDANTQLMSMFSFSSAYGSGGDTIANGTTLRQMGAGGLILNCYASAPMRFYTNNLERMRIAPTGEVFINTGGVNVAAGQVAIVTDPSHNAINIQNSNASLNTLTYLGFYNGSGGVAGYIGQASATTVTYATASDARLKDDDGAAHDVSALRAVVVHDFTWKTDGVRARGVFAQEAYDVFPAAITKGTDDTTDDGTLTKPWGTDYSKFVPDLIVGWQQHDAELADLRALLATLKGFPHA